MTLRIFTGNATMIGRFFRNNKDKVATLAAVIFAFIIYSILNSNSAEINDRKLVPPDVLKPLPPSALNMQYFRKAAIVSDAGACAKIGRDILEKKGSAVDAAVAALMCNSVVNMQSAGVGGGFMMTIFKKTENKVYCLNARETAPFQVSIDMYKNDDKALRKGALAIGVPGEINGYWKAHKKFGKLPWKDLVQPVINICEEGYNMTRYQQRSLTRNTLERDENFRKWFFDKDGKMRKPGSKIHPTKLCEFLKKLSVNGPEDFYTGELSKLFIEDMTDIDGIITGKDLSQYSAEWQEPIHITLKNGDNFYSFPTPGSGAIVALILNILDGYNFSRRNLYGTDAPVTYHRIIEAFKFAMAKRTMLGDPKFVNIEKTMQHIVSKDFADAIRLKIQDNKTYNSPSYYGADYISTDDHGTSHISVLDENGDAVAVTSTVNYYFGAGLSGKRSAFILNDVMNDFSYPFMENYFGLPASEANKLEPGKRPLSSMSPSILIDTKGNVKVVIGAAGGPKIITATAFTLMRLLWFGDSLKEAIDGARIHHILFPMTIHYEYGILEKVVKTLKSIGHEMDRHEPNSIVYALYKTEDKIIGIADSRKDGGGVSGIGEL